MPLEKRSSFYNFVYLKPYCPTTRAQPHNLFIDIDNAKDMKLKPYDLERLIESMERKQKRDTAASKFIYSTAIFPLEIKRFQSEQFKKIYRCLLNLCVEAQEFFNQGAKDAQSIKENLKTKRVSEEERNSTLYSQAAHAFYKKEFFHTDKTVYFDIESGKLTGYPPFVDKN